MPKGICYNANASAVLVAACRALSHGRPQNGLNDLRDDLVQANLGRAENAPADLIHGLLLQ